MGNRLRSGPYSLSTAYYRQIARRTGVDVAVFASARKLATLIYRLLRWEQPYVDEGTAAYEKRYQETRLRSLTAAAKTSASSLRVQLAILTRLNSGLTLATNCYRKEPVTDQLLMTQLYPPTTAAGTRHAQASAAKRHRSNRKLETRN